jgi:hypothetical protein
MHQMPIEVRDNADNKLVTIRQLMTLHNPEDIVDVLITYEQIPSLCKALQDRLPKAARKAAAASSLFESHFWSLWPASKRKVAKPACLAFWKSNNLDAKADQIRDAVSRAAVDPDWSKDGGAFIPMPITWLRQERWEASAETGSAPTLGRGRII